MSLSFIPLMIGHYHDIWLASIHSYLLSTMMVGIPADPGLEKHVTIRKLYMEVIPCLFVTICEAQVRGTGAAITQNKNKLQ